MERVRMILVAVTAILLGAALVGPAGAVITCGAVGEAESNGDGSFTFCVTVTWGFNGYAVPERIDILLEHLADCEFYNPDNPHQSHYIVPGTGASSAAEGCYDATGYPTDTIAWVGEMAEEDPDCWAPTLHIAYTNTGATESCSPLSEDEGVFCFTSYGLPMAEQTYYDMIVIKAGDVCLVCDYTGPLPDCNMWSPVGRTSWGTIKGLYR